MLAPGLDPWARRFASFPFQCSPGQVNPRCDRLNHTCVSSHRMQAVVSQHGQLWQSPLVVSLTNVAVSKQRALLHATPATQVTHASSNAAACRVRHHALHTPQAGPGHAHTQAHAAGQSSSFQVGVFFLFCGSCGILPLSFLLQPVSGESILPDSLL